MTENICFNCRFWKQCGQVEYEYAEDFPVLLGQCSMKERETTEFNFCEQFEGIEKEYE